MYKKVELPKGFVGVEKEVAKPLERKKHNTKEL